MNRLILLLLAVGAMLQTACGPKEEKPTFKVISYNIRYGTADDGKYSWESRKDATLTMLDAEQPDLIGIQEGLIDQVLFIEENYPQFTRVGVGRDDGAEQGEMTAIYYDRYRFDLLKSGTFWLSETPDSVSIGWDAACNRTATWVLLHEKKTGRDICFINTHLDHMGEVAREESVKLLVSKIGQVAPEGAAVLLAGDFNSTTSDAIFRPLDATLRSARDASPLTDQKGTFNGFGEADPTEMLDHLFFSGLEPVSFRTLDQHYGVRYISDHYPIEAVFEL